MDEESLVFALEEVKNDHCHAEVLRVREGGYIAVNVGSDEEEG